MSRAGPTQGIPRVEQGNAAEADHARGCTCYGARGGRDPRCTAHSDRPAR